MNVYSTRELITVENKGKLWRQKQTAAVGRKGKRGGYPLDGAGATHKMRACSACAGDYEDPDRTAWAPGDPDGAEHDEELRSAREEFPAEE
jgi:hypothetical protein